MVRWLALAAVTGASAWLAAAPAGAQTCGVPGTGTTACTGDSCARVSAETVSGTKGELVNVPLRFQQGPDDSQAGQGFDEVSAIAFTLSISGNEAQPLTFDCAAGSLADGSVTVGASLADDFTVVIENAQCNGRDRCLCPGDGQTRDNFVNVVVYGPRDLPEQGPVQIPVLPDDANPLLTLRMRIATDAPASIPLHVYSSVTGTPAKPQFAANLSIGDQAACDVTAAGAQSNVAFTDGAVNTGGGAVCVGDCNANGVVAINELVTGVNIVLGSANISACLPFDANDSGTVEINELIQGVNNLLGMCPS